MWQHLKICCEIVFPISTVPALYIHQGRGITWTPRNRKPEKLRDTLRECEVQDISPSNAYHRENKNIVYTQFVAVDIFSTVGATLIIPSHLYEVEEPQTLPCKSTHLHTYTQEGVRGRTTCCMLWVLLLWLRRYCLRMGSCWRLWLQSTRGTLRQYWLTKPWWPNSRLEQIMVSSSLLFFPLPLPFFLFLFLSLPSFSSPYTLFFFLSFLPSFHFYLFLLFPLPPSPHSPGGRQQYCIDSGEGQETSLCLPLSQTLQWDTSIPDTHTHQLRKETWETLHLWP